MKLCTIALTFLSPLLAGAASPDWLAPTREAELDVLHQMEQGREEVDAVISSLGQENIAPTQGKEDESLPPARQGYAVAVADGGLLFDPDHSRVTYLGNVRVNEARANMRCRHRLYIQLPPTDVKKGGQEVLDSVESSPEAPATPSSTPAPSPASSNPPQTAAPAGETPPLQVWAYDAMVDGVGNHVLLSSRGAEGVPRMRRGDDELVLDPCGEDTYILADAQGNIHVSSGKISLSWTDAEGRRGTLVAEQGRMVFNRADHTLYIPGVSHITSPDGTMLDCEESLCVTLMPEGKATLPEKGGFLSQFTGLRYSGIEKAIVTGKVYVRRPATDTTPASAVQGEICTYDGRTGACKIEGATCRLTYGTQEVASRGTHGSVSLSPEGDIRMQGEQGLCGVYELPARGESPAQRGTFETSGKMDFQAASGTVLFDRGVCAEDPTNRFSCSGPLDIRLKRGTQKVPDRQKTGMVNLAIAAYNDIDAIHAIGNVDMRYVDPQKNIPMELRGDEAVFDLSKGTAQVTSRSGKACLLSYGTYSLNARSKGGESCATVNEQGDIEVRGETIHAVLPDRDQTAQLDTSGMLQLTRETRELTLGPGSDLHAPEGILTAKDKLYITLAPAQSAAHAKSALPRYPHLSYAFGGVETARTDHGGTLQTAKASMQCTGPIRVTFRPGQGTRAGTLQNLHATAEGNVAILGKDSTDRLIRATGDSLTIDGDNKVLTGTCVTLADERNTHIASGKGARVTVDGNNNARLSGEKHVTHATGLREQTSKKDSTEKKD